MTLSSLAKDQNYQAYLGSLEDKYGLPTGLLATQQKRESNFNPDAVSSVGAQGIAQFMPATAKQYGIDPLDPMQASDGQARMLSDLAKKYNGDIPSVLAAYNWGSGNLDKKGMENAPEETRNYIKNIMGDLSAGQTQQVASNQNGGALGQIAASVGNAIIPQAQAAEATDYSQMNDDQLLAEAQKHGLPVQQPVQDYSQMSDDQLLAEAQKHGVPVASSNSFDWANATPQQRQEQVNKLVSTPQEHSDAYNMIGRPLKGLAAGAFGMIPDTMAALSNLSPTSLMTGTKYEPNITGKALEQLNQMFPTDDPTTFGGFLGQEAAKTAGGIMVPLGATEKGAATIGQGGKDVVETIGKMIPKAAEKVAPITASDVKALSQQSYKVAEDSGGIIKPELTNKWLEDVNKAVPQTKAGKVIAGENDVTKLVDRVQTLKDEPITLRSAQDVDEQLGTLADKYWQNGRMSKEGKQILDVQDKFRDMINKASEEDIIGGRAGFDAWKEGQQQWSASMRMQDIERILQRGEMMDNPATSVRSGFRMLYNNPSRMRGFTKEQKAMIKQASKAGLGLEVLRGIGSRLVSIISLSHGNVAGAIAAQGISHGARNLAGSMQAVRGQKIIQDIAKNAVRSTKGAK